MPYLPVPAVDEWSLSVQGKINSYWGVEVGYLGSHTVHEPQFVDENAPALPQGPDTGLSLQARRRFPQWGTLGTYAPIGWAKYNALMASLKNREWHGLSLIANWTWAKNIMTSNVIDSDHGDTNFRFPYIQAGLSALTPIQLFTAGYTYSLPWGAGHGLLGNTSNPVLSKIVSGWAVSGITTFFGGIPEPVSAPDVSDSAEESPMPNRVAGCNPNSVPGGQTRFEWFNTACFVLPPSGMVGNSTEGAFVDPGISNWDISILKDTRTGLPKESGDFEFRVDFFNAFNHTQFASPNSSLSSSTFGQISGTRAARLIQFVLQYNF